MKRHRNQQKCRFRDGKHMLKIHGLGKTPFGRIKALFGCLNTPFGSLNDVSFLFFAGKCWSQRKTLYWKKDAVTACLLTLAALVACFCGMVDGVGGYHLFWG